MRVRSALTVAVLIKQGLRLLTYRGDRTTRDAQLGDRHLAAHRPCGTVDPSCYGVVGVAVASTAGPDSPSEKTDVTVK